MSKAHEFASRSSGQRAIIEAKMIEFAGFLMIGDSKAAEKIREDAHTFLDSFFDSQSEVVAAALRGDFS